MKREAKRQFVLQPVGLLKEESYPYLTQSVLPMREKLATLSSENMLQKSRKTQSVLPMQSKLAIISIYKDYVPALKHLSKFSHAIIIIQNQDQSSENQFEHRIVSMRNVDEENGIIEFSSNMNFAKDTVIYDIKPYFPCEDRVKDCIVPSEYQIKNYIITYDRKDRNDINNVPNEDSIPTIDERNKQLDEQSAILISERNASIDSKEITVNSIGMIRRIEGVYYIEMDSASSSLEQLEHFSHVRVFWWFHRFDDRKYRRITVCNPPYENAPRTGVFASRSPVRPNPIAVTTARIISIERGERIRIKVSGLDCFDQTPCIQVVPYIPKVDRIDDFFVPEWLEHWPEWFNDNTEQVTKINDFLFPKTRLPHEKIALEEEGLHLANGISQRTIDSLLDTKLTKNCEGKKDRYHYRKLTKPNSRDNWIFVKGARQNNLKGIDVLIPYNQLTVLTGVSGSGKSTLVYDTIYAECQRRFLECFGTRDSDRILPKPDCDSISGLLPAVTVAQRNTNRNPRSTVGTMTDIYDYLRLLFVKIGVRHCPQCGNPIVPKSVEEITSILSGLDSGTVIKIFPFRKEDLIKDGLFNEDLIKDNQFNEDLNKDNLLKKDWIKDNWLEKDLANVNSTKDNSYTLKSNINYNSNKILNQNMGIITSPTDNNIRKYIEETLVSGHGALLLAINEEPPFLVQTTQKCYHCDRILFELTPATLSYNNPECMCPVCNGLGVRMDISIDKIIDKPHLSLLDGASPWWGNLRKFKEKPTANWMRGEVIALANDMGIDLELPWNSLSEEFKREAIWGTGDRNVTFQYSNTNGREGKITRPVEGAYHAIKRLTTEYNSDTARKAVNEFMVLKTCDSCHGERLMMEGRLLSIGSLRYPQVASMTIEELIKWAEILPSQLNTEQREMALPILEQLYYKLDKYRMVSLTYLNLDRSVTTLSGGEMQRFRLIAQLNNGLQNMLYILDEPSAGLHRKDVKQLIEVLQDLKEQGNTLLVVEHCREVIESADTIIDIGPGAGIHGGHIIAQGTPAEIIANNNSITGKYLSKSEQKHNVETNTLYSNSLDNNIINSNRVDSSKSGDNTLGQYTRSEDQMFYINKELPLEERGYLEIQGANRNNIKNIDVRFPIGVISVVTGVSGSGKSTLLFDCLYPALMEAIAGSHVSNQVTNGNVDFYHTDYGRLKGYDAIRSVIYVDQNPIGKTSRSNPATYTGVMDSIRTVFANLKESRDRGYKTNHFSFNSKEGQCDHCNGEGTISTKLSFMEDMVTICPICNGKRYRKEILSISYQGKNIYDILSMSVDEAITFFDGHDRIHPTLKTLQEVGLGYIHLGQSSTTLSGGEAQRIKLAKELCSNSVKDTLYLLDEPTTGLHFEDIKHLQCMLRKISEAGNTIIMIEHSSDMIQFADWIVELGPKGGVEGGYLMQEGMN